MSNDRHDLTRRDFLRGSAGAALVGTVGSTVLGCGSGTALAQTTDKAKIKAPSSAPRATVVLVRDPDVLNKGRKVNGPILSKMLDDGVKALLGQPKTQAAWAQLIKPTDTVGIKTNSWRFLHTPKALEQALRDRIVRAGVPDSRVAIDDRGVRGNSVFGRATALINARPLRTHHWSGVGGCIKNYIMFSDDPPSWHDDSCARLAGVWDLPEIRGKTRLNILVMLTPLFHGKGPHHFQPRYTWAYNGLLIGTDPVALDATGVRILEAKRRAHFGKDEPFAVSPKHVAVADAKFGLGVADPQRIDLVKLGWSKDVLI